MTNLFESAENKARDWNSQVLNLIKKERAEVARRYNIRIDRTNVHCNRCGRIWTGEHHVCVGSRDGQAIPPAGERIFNFFVQLSKREWREEFGIEIAITEREALERFLEWREPKRTCERCIAEGDKQYREFCRVHFVCNQADKLEEEKENGRENFNRGRSINDFGTQKSSLGQSEKCTKFAFYKNQ